MSDVNVSIVTNVVINGEQVGNNPANPANPVNPAEPTIIWFGRIVIWGVQTLYAALVSQPSHNEETPVEDDNEEIKETPVEDDNEEIKYRY